MNEQDLTRAAIQAMAWIIGIGTTVIGIILAAVGRWIVNHIDALRRTVSEEMRAFDVRISKLETIAHLRGRDARRHDDDDDGD